MKKRWLAIALLLGLAGGCVAGFAAGIFIYPFWFLDDVAAETLESGVARTDLAAGTFIDVNPSDPVHWGRGFHVYLVDSRSVRSKSDFENAGKVDLGRLRAFRGSQVYAVPAGTDMALYGSVVVWCKEFGVLISPASLTVETAARSGGVRGS